MSKSIVLIIASVLLVICCAFSAVQALSVFENMKVFNQIQRKSYSPLSKIALDDENICCMPEKLTLTNQIIEGSFNSSTYSVKKTQVKAYVDLANNRMREDFIENGSEMTIFQTQWGPNVVTHVIKGNRCTCSKTQSKLERQCLKKSSQPQQVSILGEDAYKIDNMSDDQAFSMVILKDTLKRQGICWPLSLSSISSKLAVESSFYDMVDTVDEGVFWIPSICPSMNKC